MRDLSYTVLTMMPRSLHGLTCIFIVATRQLPALVPAISLDCERGVILSRSAQSSLTSISFILHQLQISDAIAKLDSDRNRQDAIQGAWKGSVATLRLSTV